MLRCGVKAFWILCWVRICRRFFAWVNFNNGAMREVLDTLFPRRRRGFDARDTVAAQSLTSGSSTPNLAAKSGNNGESEAEKLLIRYKDVEAFVRYRRRTWLSWQF